MEHTGLPLRDYPLIEPSGGIAEEKRDSKEHKGDKEEQHSELDMTALL